MCWLYNLIVVPCFYSITTASFWPLAQVHREQGNYKDSSEAAIRLQKLAPTSAILCKAVTRLTECKEFTELERINYVRSVWMELDALPSDSTVGSVSRQNLTRLIAPTPNCVIMSHTG